MDKKFLSLLSLARKAGVLGLGEETCEKALKNKKAFLIIVAKEASYNTRKKFINKSFYYEIPCHVYGEREELNRAIGKQNITSMCILEKNFAEKFETIIITEVGECQK